MVDDGSTDGTLSILKKYAAADKRIRLIEKGHSGLTASLNIGLEHARGEWIARLDADDIAISTRLEQQLNFVQKDEDVCLLGGGCIEVDKQCNSTRTYLYATDHESLINGFLRGTPSFPHSSAFFNKEAAINIGGYNPRFPQSQDLDLWFRLSEVGKIACLETPVVKLRKHETAISNKLSGTQIVMGVCACICHFRRKANLPDPSKMDEGEWKKFVDWVEHRLRTRDHFEFVLARQILHDAWNNLNGNKNVFDLKRLSKYLLKYGANREVLSTRFYEKSHLHLVEQLQKEIPFLLQ